MIGPEDETQRLALLDGTERRIRNAYWRLAPCMSCDQKMRLCSKVSDNVSSFLWVPRAHSKRGGNRSEYFGKLSIIDYGHLG